MACADEIMEMLKSPDPEVRMTGARSLSPGDDPALLQGLLNDADWRVRRAAVEAMGDGREAWAVPYLAKALNDESWQVRQGAAFALGFCGDEGAVSILIGCLNDGDWHVRQACVSALGSFGQNPGVMPLLIDALSDPQWHVSTQAAQSLGKTGGTAAIPHLQEALKTADPAKKVHIAQAMRRLSGLEPAGKRIDREEIVEMKESCGCADCGAGKE
jgi:HEAT repeat protein